VRAQVLAVEVALLFATGAVIQLRAQTYQPLPEFHYTLNGYPVDIDAGTTADDINSWMANQLAQGLERQYVEGAINFSCGVLGRVRPSARLY